ncbi:MAG TPA: alpha/beta fold hydrolase [Thermoleophilaceae bacterium]|jgi:pimeloyl-ACP methyl ester carboxylesterase
MPIVPSTARPAAPWKARHAGDDYGAPAEPGWREVDWREHLAQESIEGRSVNYVDLGSGDGPPVVFLHGIGGNWQNWLENLPRIAQERRVVALDFPGFGLSEMPAGRITMSGYGRTVDALCERLGLGEIALVGNSMGGFIAAETAIQFPERVERLVLAAAAGIGTASLSRAPVMTWGRIITAATARGAAERDAAILRPRLRQLVFATIMRHPSRIAPELLLEISHGAGREGFMPALEAIVDYDYRERVGEIRCPTLIVWGREDMIVGVRDANEYERLIPVARKVVMEDTGHVPMLERPSTFNDLLVEFLREPRGELTADVGEPTAAAAPA